MRAGTSLALPPAVRIVVPVHQERVSPALDAARRLAVFDLDGDLNLYRREVDLNEPDLVSLARRILSFLPDVVICGAVSRPLAALLRAGGTQVIHNRCGPVSDIVGAFTQGHLDRQAYPMPGCGRRGRGRRRWRGGCQS